MNLNDVIAQCAPWAFGGFKLELVDGLKLIEMAGIGYLDSAALPDRVHFARGSQGKMLVNWQEATTPLTASVHLLYHVRDLDVVCGFHYDDGPHIELPERALVYVPPGVTAVFRVEGHRNSSIGRLQSLNEKELYPLGTMRISY